MTKTIQLRLALREEGEWWNAYIATADTMDGARLIGSIMIGAVRNPDRKQEFMDLMKAVMADGLETITGERPENFEIEPAPEAERSGHA